MTPRKKADELEPTTSPDEMDEFIAKEPAVPSTPEDYVEAEPEPQVKEPPPEVEIDWYRVRVSPKYGQPVVRAASLNWVREWKRVRADAPFLEELLGCTLLECELLEE